MTDATRELIQRMARELDLYRQLVLDDCTSTHPFADEARAYLAQPEPEGPTDEPLGDLIDKWIQEVFRKKPYGCKHPTHAYVASKAFEHGRNHAARTALAQPEPEGPTEKEILELSGEHFDYKGDSMGDWFIPISIGPTIELSNQVHAFARAVLARWGRPAVEPDAQ